MSGDDIYIVDYKHTVRPSVILPRLRRGRMPAGQPRRYASMSS